MPTKSGAGKHALHIGSFYVAGDGVATPHCTDCHGATADVGTHAGHKDQAVNIAIQGTNVKVSGYNAGDKTCENACHAVGLGVVVIGGPTAPSSARTATPAPSRRRRERPGVRAARRDAEITGNAHDGSWDADGADGAVAADCVTCHTAAPTNPSAATSTAPSTPASGPSMPAARKSTSTRASASSTP